MLPVAVLLGLWWLILSWPIVLTGLLLEWLFGPVALGLTTIAALGLLLMATPWVFGWYWIALTLMMGRPSAAARKEEALAQAISRY